MPMRNPKSMMQLCMLNEYSNKWKRFILMEINRPSQTFNLSIQVHSPLLISRRVRASPFYTLIHVHVGVYISLVINAWALSRQPKGAARAESILKKMIALHLSGDFDIQPNVISFTTGTFL